jgi:MOSC domain-containing protein YiiM
MLCRVLEGGRIRRGDAIVADESAPEGAAQEGVYGQR